MLIYVNMQQSKIKNDLNEINDFFFFSFVKKRNIKHG